MRRLLPRSLSRGTRSLDATPRRRHAAAGGVLVTILLGLAPAARAQYLESTCSLPNAPFGLNSPDGGATVHVAIAGDFFTNDNRVLSVDPAACTTHWTGTTGLFPEEIAYQRDGLGTLLALYVTDSSSGTVTVLDPSGATLATIPLPDPMGFGTSFPFGIVLNGAQTRAYVGTVDGSGEIYAIDTDPQSPTHWTQLAAETISFPGASFGRLAMWGADRLIVPYSLTDFVSWWDHVAAVDVSNPTAPSVTCDVFYATDGFGPSDVAVTAAGVAWIATSASAGGDVWAVDLAACGNTTAVSTGLGAMHGLGLTPDESIVIATGMAGSGSPGIAVVDAVRRSPLSLLDLGFLQANDILFDAAGARGFVTDQGGGFLGILGGIPTGLRLTGDATVSAGTSATVELEGGAIGRLGWFFLSFTGNGPITAGPYTLLLDPPIFILGPQPFSTAGPLQTSVAIPPNPSLVGQALYWQGVGEALPGQVPALWVSNGWTTTIVP